MMQLIDDVDIAVFSGLAMEEALMERAVEAGPFLLLWRARDAVVIGKNQNPWAECAVERLPLLGVQLARRVSGGGAVYHDEGNLNYAWISNRMDYAPDRVYEAVQTALRLLGFDVERTEESNLRVHGMKISGNAFSLRKGAAMHHGTLLVRANLERLRAALRVEEAPFSGRAIRSRRDHCANLSDWQPALDVHAVSEALQEGFLSVFGGSVKRASHKDWLPSDWSNRLARMASWDWVMGLTPEFVYQPQAGPTDLRVVVRNGRVERVEGAGPASEKWQARIGQPFEPDIPVAGCSPA